MLFASLCAAVAARVDSDGLGSVSDNLGMDDQVAELNDRGYVCIRTRFRSAENAFHAGQTLIDSCSAADGLGELVAIGDFVLPPIDGQPTREFQTLHFDFGLPLDPKADQDVARYTALYISSDVGSVSAVTRIVPLTALLSQRMWRPLTELLGGLIAYGRTHGAWDDARGYVEGSLARVVEGAVASAPHLPSVKADPGFLCGTEFDTLRAEVAFFERHGLRVKDVEVELDLEPCELLVFDNLAVAHGRRGAATAGPDDDEQRKAPVSANGRLRDDPQSWLISTRWQRPGCYGGASPLPHTSSRDRALAFGIRLGG